ncbi:MAG: hypothetical protein Q8888_01185 [Vigna little leaf phytoplasma]|nr:hypothetical protein [Vigna little leaf phytoplasma]
MKIKNFLIILFLTTIPLVFIMLIKMSDKTNSLLYMNTIEENKTNKLNNNMKIIKSNKTLTWDQSTQIKQAENKIFKIITETENLEQKIKKEIANKDALLSIRKKALNYINTKEFKEFKKSLYRKYEQLSNNHLNIEEKIKIIEKEQKDLEITFNSIISSQMNNLIKEFTKKTITEEELEARINFILDNKNNNKPEVIDHITWEEYQMKLQQRIDNKKIDILEEISKEHINQMNDLKAQKDTYYEKLKELQNDFKKLLEKDYQSQKELEQKEAENALWKKNKFFRTDPQYKIFMKELEKMYPERQKIIQSVGNMKQKVGETLSNYNYYNNELKKQEQLHNEKIQKSMLELELNDFINLKFSKTKIKQNMKQKIKEKIKNIYNVEDKNIKTMYLNQN